MVIATVRHDSPLLGRWTQSEWRPAHLRGVVERVWLSEGALAQRGERIFPNGTLELIVNLGDPFRVVDGAAAGFFASPCLFGMRAAPVVIEQPARHRVLGVRLHPRGAYALLARWSMTEVVGGVVDLGHLVGSAAAELAERCHAALSPAQCLQVAAQWVCERLRGARRVEPEVEWAAARIERSGGAEPIWALRQQLGLSKTRLVAAFRQQIGLTPKLYARIIRFRRALGLLQQGAGSLAEVALATGYYDQPHMSAEFRELGGLTPRAFAALCYPGGDGATAVEPAAGPPSVIRG